MDFGDIADRMRKLKDDQQDDASSGAYDYDESYRLRGKMLGVMIRDARLDAARTLEDCAHLLGITSQEIESWEYGDRVPSLPQLELLAYYLDVPVTHFWAQATMQNDRTPKRDAQSDYMTLRHRMVGALLRKAREEHQQTLEDVSQVASISVETLQKYESGDVPIPMHQLSVLAGVVNKTMGYFLESSSYVGELLQTREDWKHFIELDDDVREFAANPLNLGFIKIAIMFSRMPTDELRRVAEGLLDITM